MSKASRKRITRQELLEGLQENASQSHVRFARWLIDQASLLDLRIKWRDAGPVFQYEDPRCKKAFTFLQLMPNGKIGQYKPYLRFGLGKVDLPITIAENYLTKLAKLLPNAKFYSKNTNQSGLRKPLIKVPPGSSNGQKYWPDFSTMYEHRNTWAKLTTDTIAKIDKLLTKKRAKPIPKPGGAGYLSDAKEREAIELRAMKIVVDFFEGQGYDVEDTSAKKPYDLVCRRKHESLRVEVKGTKNKNPKSVILTKNEVANSRLNSPPTDLVVVGQIRIQKSKQEVTAHGGKILHHVKDWVAEDEKLTATEFRYDLN